MRLLETYAKLFDAYITAVLLIVAFLVSGVSADENLLNELIARQSNLASVRAKFSQEKYDPLLGRPIINEGKFYFKPGVGVRWEYEDVLVVYDGTILYVYSPEMKEVEKIKGEEGFMGPLAFDVKVLSEDYELVASRDGKDIKLDLSPKKEMPFLSMTMIFPGDDGFPSEVSITESSGDTSAIRFSEVRLNEKLRNDLFVFTPPPGTTINERTLE